MTNSSVKSAFALSSFSSDFINYKFGTVCKICQAIRNIELPEGKTIPEGYINATLMFLNNEYILQLADLHLVEFTIKLVCKEDNLRIYLEDGTLFIHPLIAYLGGLILDVDLDYLFLVFQSKESQYFELLDNLWLVCWQNLNAYLQQTKSYFHLLSLTSRNITPHSKLSEVFCPLNQRNNEEKKSEVTGDIYLFINKEKTKIKIGFTSDIQARLKQVESASGESLTVYKIWKNKKLTSELDFHTRNAFHPSRLNGEWYSYNSEIIDLAIKFF